MAGNGRGLPKRMRMLFATALTLVATLVAVAEAGAYSADFCGGSTAVCYPGGHEETYGTIFYANLTGVYAAERTCFCHTVGAHASITSSVAYATGSAFHSYSGSNFGFGTVVNGTGSPLNSGTSFPGMVGHSNY